MLSEYVVKFIDVICVVCMIFIYDIVEIDVGDMFVFNY